MWILFIVVDTKNNLKKEKQNDLLLFASNIIHQILFPEQSMLMKLITDEVDQKQITVKAYAHN